jgi:hypothetical protein
MNVFIGKMKNTSDLPHVLLLHRPKLAAAHTLGAPEYSGPLRDFLHARAGREFEQVLAVLVRPSSGGDVNRFPFARVPRLRALGGWAERESEQVPREKENEPGNHGGGRIGQHRGHHGSHASVRLPTPGKTDH